MLNVELGLRQKSKEFLPFSFLICHLSFVIFKSFSFVICHFFNFVIFFPFPFSFLICHFSFVIFKSLSFLIFLSVNESEIHA